MANEFKVKKGLIVDGSNTVLDIQGTAGQLFSVTDSLTGDLFSVSDVSGIPILNVNSSGLSTFDGDVKIDGAVENNGITTYNTPAGGVAFNLDAAADNYGTFRLRTNGNANKWDVGMKNDNDFYIYNQATSAQAFEIDTANNIATFSATTKSTRFTSTTASGLHFSNYTGTQGWQIGSDSTAAGMYIYNENGTYAMKLTSAGTATFAGSGTFAGTVTGTSAQFIDTTNPDGGGGAGEGGSLIVEGRRDGTANLISLRARDASAPTVALPDGQGGLIRWQGFDGTDFAQMGAIAVIADGQAVANSDAPSKMIFYTTADGGETLTTALTLDKSQNATFEGQVVTGGDLTVGGTTGAGGNALAVNRGSDGAQALRIQNSGEVVTTANYFYAASSGTSMYVQNTAIFRGAIQNDGGDVRIADNLKVDNKIGIGVSPTTLLHLNGTGDAIRVESTNTGAGGAQIDLLHFKGTNAPADEDTHAVINMGGYYSGTTSVYGTQIKSIWTDVSERQSRLEFTTCDTTVGTVLTLAHDKSATFAGGITTAGGHITGNLGVGTAPTSRQLSVFRSTAGSIANFLHYTDSSTFQGLYIQVSQSTNDVILQSSGSSGGGFKFYSGNAEKAGIDASGNATFEGEITSGDDINSPTKIVVGESATSEVRLKKTNAGNAKLSFYNNDGTSSTQQSYLSLDATENIVLYGASGVGQYFYAGGVLNETKIGVNSTFAGDITQADGKRIWFRGSSATTATGGQSYIFSDGLNLKIKGDDNVQILGDGGGTIANFDYTGKSSFNTSQTPIAKIQASAYTFSGGNGVFNNDRLGIMNNGSLTSIVNASTYNDPTYPDYGLVFIQGPSTSSYNVWSLSPDGPVKGSDLNFIYQAQATNIHTQPSVFTLHGSTSSATLAGDFNIDSSSASGSTVLDVQGTAGQLFSVTNSLTGDLFSVSDVSGIPIFNVNSSGAVDVDGNINLGYADKINFGTSGSGLEIYSDSGSNSYIKETGGSGSLVFNSNEFYFQDNSTNTRVKFVNGGGLQLYKDADPYIQFFEGTSNRGDIFIDTSADYMTIRGASGHGIKILANGAADNATTGITLDTSNNVTIGGTITSGSSGVGNVYVGNTGTGNYARFHTNNTHTYFDMSCGDVIWRQGSAGGSHRFEHAMATGTFTSSGDIVAFGSPSDKRLKENIKPIESALSKVSKLQGVTFDWKQSDSILDIKEDIGFIAQDVKEVVPELVRENEDGMLSMRHQGIAPILLEAIKELKAEIEKLKSNKCNCNK